MLEGCDSASRAVWFWVSLVWRLLRQESARPRGRLRPSAWKPSLKEEEALTPTCPHPPEALYRSGNKYGSYVHCRVCRQRLLSMTAAERDVMHREMKRASAQEMMERLEAMTAGQTYSRQRGKDGRHKAASQSKTSPPAAGTSKAQTASSSNEVQLDPATLAQALLGLILQQNQAFLAQQNETQQEGFAMLAGMVQQLQCTEAQARGFPHSHGKVLEGVVREMIDEADRDVDGEVADRHIFRINRCGAIQPAAAACSSCEPG